MKKILFLSAALAMSVASAWAGEPLKWSKPVIDGAIYAIVNVQPASVGKNYYLNNTDGVLTPVETTGIDSDYKWPATAKFVAEKQADGKFAFKNVDNGQYLAYKSHNTGENDKKGFVSSVADWSAWTMNESSRAGFENTYWPVCQKRSSTNATVSTLLIANNGAWNAWLNSECTNAGYSNNYGFVLLSELYTVHYNYIFNGQKVAEEEYTIADGRAYPALNLPYGVTTSTSLSGTVTADDNVDIVCSLAADYPFQYSADYANATWYTLTIRSSYHPYYDAATDNFVNTGNGGTKVNADKGFFAFVGSPWGTKIINRAAGAEKAVTGQPTANNSALTTTAVADAIEFVFENNSGHYVFAAKDNRIAHLNNVSSDAKLGFWVHANSATDTGSTLAFEEAD